jgi:hypothetical protein
MVTRVVLDRSTEARKAADRIAVPTAERSVNYPAVDEVSEL